MGFIQFLSDHDIVQIPLGNGNAVQNLLPGAFKSLILHLDAGAAFKTDVRQSRNVLAPVHIAITGQLGRHVIQRICHHTAFVELVLIELDVLEVNMENLVLELIQRLYVIDLLPDKVAGIVVQAKVVGVGNGEQLAPDASSLY